MSVLLFGISHQNTPMKILEKFVFPQQEQEKIIIDLQKSLLISEVMVLVTCNRMEIYAVVEAFHPALASISEIISNYSGVPISVISEYAQVKYADATIKHIFSLASGLESALVGEQQIVGQLRGAYHQGQRLHSIGAILHHLAQASLRVGKKVRTTTGLDQAGGSLISIAIEQAQQLSNRPLQKVVVVGAGAMGSLAVTHVVRLGVPEITIVNRTVENAQKLVQRESAYDFSRIQIHDLSALIDQIADADVVISCTGATDVIIDDAVLAAAMCKRDNHMASHEDRKARDTDQDVFSRTQQSTQLLPHGADHGSEVLTGEKEPENMSLAAYTHSIAGEEEIGEQTEEEIGGQKITRDNKNPGWSLAQCNPERENPHPTPMPNGDSMRISPSIPRSIPQSIPWNIPTSRAGSAVGQCPYHRVSAKETCVSGSDPRLSRGYPVFVDLSMPADIALSQHPDVSVITLSKLMHYARNDSQKIHDRILLAEDIISQELVRYRQQQNHKNIVPTVTALREYASEIVDEEWYRLEAKLSNLDQRKREEIKRSINRIVDKMLHVPTVRIKELASSSDAEQYTKALQELFSLRPGVTETIYAVDQVNSCPWEGKI